METSSNTAPTSSQNTKMVLPGVKNDSTSNKTTTGPPPVPAHAEPAPKNNHRRFCESEVPESKENVLDVCETEWGVDVCETEWGVISASAMEKRAIQQALKDRSAATATTAMAGMDAANAKAYQILVKEGSRSAVNHMFTRADGSTRSYSEMRSLYG